MQFRQFISLLITLMILTGITGAGYTHASGGGWTDDFQANPLANGWNYTGLAPALFGWNSTLGKINAEWNSGATTSQLSHPVDFGLALNQNQSFSMQFDVNFSQFSVGTFSNYPLSIGLFNSTNSLNRSANIIEWSYYLGTDSTYGGPNYAGFSVISKTGGYSNCSGAYTFITPAYTLQTAVIYHVQLSYNAASKQMTLTMTANGSPFGSFPALNLCGVDFTVDRLGVINWNDDTPIAWGGPATYKASGTVDNVQLTYPLAVEDNLWKSLE